MRDDRPLNGLRIALSVSASSEPAEQGFPELVHATSTIVRGLTRAGATIVFCPRLPLSELSEAVVENSRMPDRGSLSLELFVPEIEYRNHQITELRAVEASIRPSARLTLVTSRGRAHAPGTSLAEASNVPAAEALTALRTHVARTTGARVAIGGRIPAFSEEPGIVEECRLSAEAGATVLALGGFGGAAALVAESSHPLPEMRPAFSRSICTTVADQLLATSRDPVLLTATVLRVLGAAVACQTAPS